MAAFVAATCGRRHGRRLSVSRMVVADRAAAAADPKWAAFVAAPPPRSGAVPLSVSVLAVGRGEGVVLLAPSTGAPMGAARGGSDGVSRFETKDKDYPMGKSSSVKKKSSKYSSQGRSKKRTKPRTKSKKLRLRSDDDSSSSVSASSSSSTDFHRSRKSRLRSRKDVKRSKKRARSPSSTSEGSPYVRKWKRSKKADDSAARKKKDEKKKNRKDKKMTRRDVSVSSTSSESCNCTECRSSSSCSDESKYNRHRGRSGSRDNNIIRSEKTVIGSKRRYRSRSCSSCSGRNESHDSSIEEKVTYEDNTKRLRSVITRPSEDNEGKETEIDEHKEEMIYDQDDYPSCRSNDSNDGGYKRESVHHLHATSKKIPSNDERLEDRLVSMIEVTKLPDGNKDDEYESRPALAGSKTDVLKNETSMANGNMVGEELESFLRQKALENLRMFRGGRGGTNSNRLIEQKDKSPMEPKSSTGVAKSGPVNSKEDGPGVMPEEITCSLQNNEIIADNSNGDNEYEYAKNKIDLPEAGPENVKTDYGSGSNKSRLVRSAFRQAVSSGVTKRTEAFVSEEADEAKPVTPNFVCQNAAQPAHMESSPIISSNCKTEKDGTASGSYSAEPSSSCPASATGDTNSNKLQDESKEVPKFEQKTMSVERGGEVLQVSYKVYIPPRRTPAARRQLNR
ncbi:hypothetical protein Tsubulata_023639 [Turnera subulata]|uniref:Uncharacterized protein n=1 Tax=Turnera subulata TaxID=218843 RepID=A0A9Q0F3E3_9ROSI|nr:hypothetical protein Tsubulata_023639 [Turnera subulata]